MPRKPKAITEDAGPFLERVRAYKDRFGLTDGQMATEKLKVGTSTYSKWFGRSHVSPQPEVVIRFAELTREPYYVLLKEAGYWPEDVPLPATPTATRVLDPDQEMLVEAWEANPSPHWRGVLSGVAGQALDFVRSQGAAPSPATGRPRRRAM